MKSVTSWKILIALIIMTIVFVAVAYSSGKIVFDDIVFSYPKDPSPVGTSTTSHTPTTTENRVMQNLMVACAAPGKNQTLGAASSTKRLMWAATPSIGGKVVDGAILEWALLTPEKKIIQVGKDIGLTYIVERASFPVGVKKQTYTMQVKVTVPVTGQFLTASCASVDVTLL